MSQNLKPRSTVKRAAIGTGLVLALMAGTTAAGDALHPTVAAAYCGPCVTDTPTGAGVGLPPTISEWIAAMSAPGYRPAGVTPGQWEVFRTANFSRLKYGLADQFAGRLWAAAMLTPAERAVVQKDGGTKGQELSDAKRLDYRAVVDEIDRASGYAWASAPMIDRDNQRAVAEATVAELRKSLSIEALAYGGVGFEPAPVDGTYGNVVARAYAPGGILFGVGDASLSIDANARAGAVR